MAAFQYPLKNYSTLLVVWEVLDLYQPITGHCSKDGDVQKVKLASVRIFELLAWLKYVREPLRILSFGL